MRDISRQQVDAIDGVCLPQPLLGNVRFAHVQVLFMHPRNTVMSARRCRCMLPRDGVQAEPKSQGTRPKIQKETSHLVRNTLSKHHSQQQRTSHLTPKDVCSKEMVSVSQASSSSNKFSQKGISSAVLAIVAEAAAGSPLGSTNDLKFRRATGSP